MISKDTQFADMWIAHTRQPTNSPGSSPIWSHPFASFDCAIVHNGDISSFGANLELLNSLGYKSHVGTDSEVVARSPESLDSGRGTLGHRGCNGSYKPVRGSSRGNSLLETLSRNSEGQDLTGHLQFWRDSEDDKDAYLIALTDRSKFRPLLFGEDEERYFVASEENQIRRISPNARVWTPEPGSFFIASVKRGLIASGTTREVSSFIKEDESHKRQILPNESANLIDAFDLGFQEINARISEAYEAGEEKISFSHPEWTEIHRHWIFSEKSVARISKSNYLDIRETVSRI